MRKKITVNAELLDEIVANYDLCASETGNSIEILDKAKDCVLENYSGQGNEIVEETFTKIKEHLEFLGECYAQMSNYVTYTKSTMEDEDNRLTTVMRRTR